MPRAGKTLGNPVGVVLGEELLILLLPSAVGPRIAPAIEQVAASAVAAAGVAGCLGSGRAMVDDPEFAERPDAHRDLIEIGVVGHAVEMRVIGIDARRPVR